MKSHLKSKLNRNGCDVNASIFSSQGFESIEKRKHNFIFTSGVTEAGPLFNMTSDNCHQTLGKTLSIKSQ